MAIDDEATISLTRLFNEPAGKAYLVKQGVPETLVENLRPAWYFLHRQPVGSH
jgi:hypothetical protein